MTDDLPPDTESSPMDEAWNRSDGYEFRGRPLNFSRSRYVLAEKIGLNMDKAAARGTLETGENEGSATVHYDGMLEDVCILLYVASLEDAGVRRARRNPDIARDEASEIFDLWDIPLMGPDFDKAVEVAMSMLMDVRTSFATPEGGGEGSTQRTDDAGK